MTESWKRVAYGWMLVLVIGGVARADSEYLTHITTLNASVPLDGARFGHSVAVDGNLVLVGTFRPNTFTGSVELFEVGQSGVTNSWSLTAPVTAVNNEFGYDVAIHSGTIVIGAQKYNTNVNDTGAGIIYSVSDPSTGSVLPGTASSGDQFGASVSVSGNTIFVGGSNSQTSGRVRIYDAQGGGTLTQTLVPPVAMQVSNMDFGRNVQVHGDVAIVSAVRANVSANKIGAGITYRNIGGTWTEDTALISPVNNIGENDSFGDSVAIHGAFAAVGAPRADVGATINAGSVSMFHYDGANWQHVQDVVSPNPMTSSDFGRYIAMNDRFMAIGAIRESTVGTNGGAVFLYERTDNQWDYVETLLPDENGAHFFGNNIAMSDNRLVIGSTLTPVNGLNQAGVVYVYDLVPEPASALLLVAGALGIMRPRKRVR